MTTHTFIRPDWSLRPAEAVQNDVSAVAGNDGCAIGRQRVHSHPYVAVQQMSVCAPEDVVRQTEVFNVPAALGLLDVDCRGEAVWRIHGRDFLLSGRRQMLLYMVCPEDGFSHVFPAGVELRMSNAFASMDKLRAMAERFPDTLGAICRCVDAFGGEDGAIDMSEFLGSPVQQNALAAVFAQPLLGNSSEAFIFDNVATYLGGLSEQRQPSPSLVKARYDSALRSKMYEARDIIGANYGAPLSLQALATAVGTNENYLKAGFKHEFGTTVFGYLYECRMQAARLLLLDTALPVDQIAARVGYTDPVSFYGPFKRRFGLSPGQYRSLNAAQHFSH